jgi:hypothetical protein
MRQRRMIGREVLIMAWLDNVLYLFWEFKYPGKTKSVFG